MSNGQHRQPNPTPSGGSIGPASPTNVGTYASYTIVNTFGTVSADQGTIQEARIRAGEIKAYRAWRIGSDGLLHSMYMEDFIWTPHQIEKTDLHYREGFHAYKTLERVKMEYGGTGVVFGEVALWGEVIEHEWGYRAQYAKIIRIMEIKGEWSFLALRKMKLRARYGV
jgi:hypothetical protein